MLRHPSWSASLSLVALAIGGCRNNGTVAEVEECVPGETLVIGCAETCGIGSCTGDPVLRVCDGAIGLDGCRETGDSAMYTEVDDSCGSTCPRARVTCPTSGSVAILTRAYTDRYTCELGIEHRGILPPGGRAPETVSCTPGTPVEIGCSLACGVGECDGYVSLRTCDGTVSVADCSSGTGASIRDTTGSSGCDTRCPEYVLTCPASGSLTVVPRDASSSGGAWVCEWQAAPAPNRPGETVVCSPGQRYFVGCAAGCGMGTCRGDGTLRVCDGNVPPDACLAITDTTMTLQQATRASCDGDCPQADVTCPPSGAITVVSFASYDDEGFGCDWTMRPAGIGE